MSFKYNVVERGKPSDSNAPKKYYTSVTSTGRRTLRQFANRTAAYRPSARAIRWP